MNIIAFASIEFLLCAYAIAGAALKVKSKQMQIRSIDENCETSEKKTFTASRKNFFLLQYLSVTFLAPSIFG
jgi:hypothetical protein